jgi:phosphoglycolate phosphatase
LKQLGSTAENSVYIGDSDVDIETAINAKIKSVGCEWGFRGKEELVQAGATYTVSKPSDIKDILK